MLVVLLQEVDNFQGTKFLYVGFSRQYVVENDGAEILGQAQ